MLMMIIIQGRKKKKQNIFQLMDSNHGPRGYGPRTLPLRQAERWEAATNATRSCEVTILQFFAGLVRIKKCRD